MTLFPPYAECISGLDGFSYIWVLFIFNLNIPRNDNPGWKAKVKPRLRNPDFLTKEVGLFSTRAPHRPNPIGLSLLKVVEVDSESGVIIVEGTDLINNTPILDIKPYIPSYDSIPDARVGWLEDCEDIVGLDYQSHSPPHKSRLKEFCDNFYKSGELYYFWNPEFNELVIKMPDNKSYRFTVLHNMKKSSERKRFEQSCALEVLTTLGVVKI